MWTHGNSRERRAVLTALAAVGDSGMTLLALGVAVNLPEPALQAVLERLIATGHVRRCGDAAQLIASGRRAPMYHLTRPSYATVPVPRRHA